MGEVKREPVTFEFVTDGPACKGMPVVNGRNVMGATSVDVHLDANSFPVVTLSLWVTDLVKLGLGAAEVKLDEGTREALISLGWTPPAGVSGRQRVALDVRWAKDGQERRELFGPWVQGDPETEEGAVAHMMAAHRFIGEWGRVSGREPSEVEVTAVLLTDPDEWVRQHGAAGEAAPSGTEPVTP